MSEAWSKKLAKLSTLYEDKIIIWWRREPFHKDPYKDQIPKWHIFLDRKQDEERKFEYRWEAKCGYTRNFSEGLLEQYPQLNLSKKAPKKTERCIKCLQQELRIIK